jgi:Fe-S-cluster containining protein
MSANSDSNCAIQDDANCAASAALAGLERQVERGSLYTHTALGVNAQRLSEVESFTYGLIDALVKKGLISTDEIGEATRNVRSELKDGTPDNPGAAVIRLDEDKTAERAAVQVDCASRLHICKAVCCKLEFALSTAEVEAGNIKWDLGRPYLIRHEADGHCTHYDRGKGCCSVYENRPSVCRDYSCANDERIWKNFEKMELNQQWIDEHVRPTEPRALKVLVIRA